VISVYHNPLTEVRMHQELLREQVGQGIYITIDLSVVK